MGQGKILIVDDEPLMCDSLKVLLGRDGFDAKSCTNGLDAVSCFSTEGFDVVLLDMHMPEISGFELMDLIQLRCPETFVVVITGRASVDSVVESLRRGAFDYLRKPFEHEELLKTVNNALNQKRLERKRKAAEDALHKAHEELERRVEERTAELETANAQLMKEIEERKHTEQQLHAVNEEVKHFARAVSHDLRTPLISVQGFSLRLEKDFGFVLGEKGMGYLHHIVSSARRMETLVSDLLTLSMIGQVLADDRDVSCRDILQDVLSNLAVQLRDKCIELIVPKNLPTIRCDGERLFQVLENLITNAVKYIGDGPSPRIEVGYEDHGASHVFFVKDNGIGIDPEFHGRIFEKFFRHQDAKQQEGTGLGLPIVQRIVDRLGGEVWVASEKGKGATFHFSIPKTIGADHGETVRRDRCGL